MSSDTVQDYSPGARPLFLEPWRFSLSKTCFTARFPLCTGPARLDRLCNLWVSLFMQKILVEVFSSTGLSAPLIFCLPCWFHIPGCLFSRFLAPPEFPLFFPAGSDALSRCSYPQEAVQDRDAVAALRLRCRPTRASNFHRAQIVIRVRIFKVRLPRTMSTLSPDVGAHNAGRGPAPDSSQAELQADMRAGSVGDSGSDVLR